MVYVDEAIYKKSSKGRVLYCHMIADSLQELHAFAASIGVKSHFFHKSAKYLHYDLTAEQRLVAISSGAVTCTSKDIVRKSKSMRNIVQYPVTTDELKAAVKTAYEKEVAQCSFGGIDGLALQLVLKFLDAHTEELENFLADNT